MLAYVSSTVEWLVRLVSLESGAATLGGGHGVVLTAGDVVLLLMCYYDREDGDVA